MAMFKNAMDFDEIESDLTALCSRFHVLSIGYDLVTSAQESRQLRLDGVPMALVPGDDPELWSSNPDLDVATRWGRLRHDSNPVLEWCLCT